MTYNSRPWTGSERKRLRRSVTFWPFPLDHSDVDAPVDIDKLQTHRLNGIRIRIRTCKGSHERGRL